MNEEFNRVTGNGLTIRAVLTGSVIGGLLAVANVYIGLRTGWFFSMALVACLGGVAAWRVVRTPLTIFEANCMQSTASSAAYATGAMLVGVVPALLSLTGANPEPIAIAAWITCVGGLGVTLAIPLKRQLIDREELRFPSGTAAAIMLQQLYAATSDARTRTRVLLVALAAGVVVPFGRESVVLAAAGVFVGLRTTAWMIVGGAVDLGMWLGAPMLVAYALVALASHWRSFKRAEPGATPPRSEAELPRSWFVIGLAITGGGALALGAALFGIPLALGALAIALAIGGATVAARITGETDVTPGGPIAKVATLVFGDLYLASLAHGAAVASADLLNDLKSGHILHANPRRQFIAQALGIVPGAIASVAAYYLLVPDRAALDGYAAPAAKQFAALYRLQHDGLGGLAPLEQQLVVIGAGIGLGLAIAERLAPRWLARWLPSPAGLGLGLLLPLPASIAMAVGGGIASAISHVRPAWRDAFVWPSSAGLLAGGSLGGVAGALLRIL